MTTTGPGMKPIRTKLAAAAAACALLTTAAMASPDAASASAAPPHTSTAELRAALRRDLSRYLTARRTAEHISAVSLRVTFPGSRPAISLATGTTRYDGGPPVPASALWQIGSNTKAFTAVIMLQLESEGKLSISDPTGKWLPQYPAWRHITIRQLLDMTSRIPDYLYQPPFIAAFAANQRTRFTAARLVSYAADLPPGPAGWHYTNTDYILAQMIIQKVTRDTYADQLTRRIITPLRPSRTTPRRPLRPGRAPRPPGPPPRAAGRTRTPADQGGPGKTRQPRSYPPRRTTLARPGRPSPGPGTPIAPPRELATRTGKAARPAPAAAAPVNPSATAPHTTITPAGTQRPLICSPQPHRPEIAEPDIA